MSFLAICRSWLGACTLSAAAAAQSAPAFEVGANYSYNQLDLSDFNNVNQSGGSLYGEYFFSPRAGRWHARSTLGLVAQFGGSSNDRASLYSYMFGPRFNYEWKKSHLLLYGEFEFGGARSRVNGVTSTGLNGSLTRNSFAFGTNDGLGVVIGRRYIVNLFQSEFIGAEMPDIATGNSRWRDDFRVSGGLGFRFGQR
jgi:hypothetical protein